MVNTDDFIKRLEIILDYYNISASVFADKMGVQRSGLSHLMSGRNKPSLDFVLKILENFQEVDFYWLMNGDGVFPKNEGTKEDQPGVPAQLTPPPTPLYDTNNQGAFDLFSSEEVPVLENKTEPDLFSSSVQKQTETIRSTDSSAIERIVVFYKNGTFKNYNPEN